MALTFGRTLRIVPDALVDPPSRLFSTEGVIIFLPCFLSTAILAPWFIRVLERALLSGRLPFKKVLSLGILFGVVATFVTCALSVIIQVIKGENSSAIGFIGKVIGGAFFAFLSAPAVILWCLPFILVSGVIFVHFNLFFIGSFRRSAKTV